MAKSVKATDLTVPEIGESVSEVEIGEWLVGVGDHVEVDQGIVVLETDKATVELPAPVSGVLTEQLAETGETREVGDVVGKLEEGDAPVDDDGGEEEGDDPDEGDSDEAEQASTKKDTSSSQKKKTGKKRTAKKTSSKKKTAEKKETSEEEDDEPRDDDGDGEDDASSDGKASDGTDKIMPAAARLIAEHDVDPDDLTPTGPGGRILKADVQAHLAYSSSAAAGGGRPLEPRDEPADESSGARGERVEPMSRLRRTIAKRLVEAQQQAALLTTFNEIDMTAVKALRAEYKEAFAERYGVKLGFMSFFVKAVVDALKQTPALNAAVRDESIVYHDHQDIGIAVGSGKGLVVPVLRDADHMSFADVELAIGDFAERAQSNKLSPDELEGGTFTISNGGVYGSLLSTPIVNPPQSGVLGLHGIFDRPVGRDGEVVLAPMMYVALTYDHRIVDGREAVTFLKRIKDAIETPSRMLLEI